MKKFNYIGCWSFFLCASSYSGIMRHDVNVQDYRDFAENLGKYTAGATDIPVYKKDGSLSGYLDFNMPDFSMLDNSGRATLISPSYIASVKHNTGYQSVNFGNNARYAETYRFINRNDHPTIDFHLPRLNKVVTDAAPIEAVNGSDFRYADPSRYLWYTRAGTGTQEQVNEEQTGRITLTGAYAWKSGGTINAQAIKKHSTNLSYIHYGPDNVLTSPLSISTNSGDSGSPILAYDAIDNKWKIVAVHRGGSTSSITYQKLADANYFPDHFQSSIINANTSPDVIDNDPLAPVLWKDEAIFQNDNLWSWSGLDKQYQNVAPAKASNEELDATKDLRFNGAGGKIILADSVNMGAAKLQFSNNYTVTADNKNATWAGGGIEVDKEKNVLWQLNGIAGDKLHKIGQGTLHINATGMNEGGLNIGDGTAILDQQADVSGNKQAFSSVTLVSGRPTVVLNDAKQVDTRNINFGYRGGILDLNGNALSFTNINATDNGAVLVNHNSDQAAGLSLTGFSGKDIVFRSWSSAGGVPGVSGVGVVGDIYRYNNPKTKKVEYFQLKKTSYSYLPTDQSSNPTWDYLGTDPDAAIDHRVKQLNELIFRGFIGERDNDKINGVFNVNFKPEINAVRMTLAGGMNLNGSLMVEKGTMLLSGQQIDHAAGVVIDDDWSTSFFQADKIVVNDNAALQVGEYAAVKADIEAGENTQITLGYNNSNIESKRLWRCYSVINSNKTSCSQPQRDALALDILPASEVTGNISLANYSALYLGKVNYQGAIHSSGENTVTMDSSAFWQMTADSYIDQLSAQTGSQISIATPGTWHPSELVVNSLDAKGLTVNVGVKPVTAQSDKLTITSSATGGGNYIDVSLILDEKQPVSLLDDIVMVDAPESTAHDYFSLPPLYRSFSIYTPIYQVKESITGRVQWVLLHNREPQPQPEENIIPDENVDPEDTPTNNTDETASLPDNGVFNPDDWFTIQDNLPLMRQTQALLTSRQYIFSEEMSQLYQRMTLLRARKDYQGMWTTFAHNKGEWWDVKSNQQTLALGWDKTDGNKIIGFSAGYTHGNAKNTGKETHSVHTLGGNYSFSFARNGFVDIAARYMYVAQEFDFDPAIAINDRKGKSHIIAGGIRSGFQFKPQQDTLVITPYIGLHGGYLPGYSLSGETAGASLTHSAPYAAITGIDVQKAALWKTHPDLSINFGVEYQYTPGHSGSRISLEDQHARRNLSSLSDNRYRLHAGISGKITDRWSAQAKAGTSIGGTFQNNISGIVGIGYRF